MNRVGLPRALLYYRYAPVWQAFFQTFGVEVLISPPTTSQVLTRGAARVVPETCLPVKIYCGHVLSLIDRVDCVFVPSIHCLRPGTHSCPKLIGLPDLIANVIPEAPLLTVDVETESLWPSFATLTLLVGEYWRINPLSVRRAVEQARAAHDAYRTLLLQGIDPPQAIDALARGDELALGSRVKGQSALPTVAVVGHPYNLYDDYATHRLLVRLRALGVRVRTSDSIHPVGRWASVEQLGQAPYWTFEDEIVGAAGSLLQRDTDGLISVAAFGCAPDSVMLGVLAQAARRVAKPYMSLILDEHSGQAGLITRLEAFVDMLLRRKEKT
jgi:predicted nucleotide-binding protein (sugar kinase/HSP70/actin superfamily)